MNARRQSTARKQENGDHQGRESNKGDNDGRRKGEASLADMN